MSFHKNYCVCPFCGWVEEEVRKKDEKLKERMSK